MAGPTKKTPRPPLPAPVTGSALLAFVGVHVSYEVESVGAAVYVLRRHSVDQPEHRFAVEGLLLHARNLHEFLATDLASRKFRTTVVGIDACPNWIPQRIFDRTTLVAVHRMLAHVSSDRISGTGVMWRSGLIGSKTADVVEAWTSQLPAGSERTRIERACRYLRSALP